MSDPDAIEIVWNPAQACALSRLERYVDLEGGIRAGKTTPLCQKVAWLVQRYPGIHCLLARWTDDALGAQLKPAWRAFATMVGLTLSWHADEQYDEIVGTGSRVYLRGLRASEDTNRYAKFRGLTLAFIGVDQAEELPFDIWQELQGRLSQPGYPQQAWITPQPPGPDHWICREFPLDNHRRDYVYIHTNVYDNAKHMGAEYIAALESAYPLGSATRRTLLDGHRGLAVKGEPVYAGYFSRSMHIRSVEMNSRVELIEAWDWGHGHPCVSWCQFDPIGAFCLLGAVMGEAMFLEDFVPAALTYRQMWCPNPLRIVSTGDPAGLDMTNQGTRTSKVREILALNGVHPTALPNANQPDLRYDAIQATAKYMRQIALDGQPAFRLNPRAIKLTVNGPEEATFTADGFEAGYIWGEYMLRGRQTFRVPKKDGYYDHFQNTIEYAQLSFGPPQATQQTLAKVQAAEVRRSQQDRDPADHSGRMRYRRA